MLLRRDEGEQVQVIFPESEEVEKIVQIEMEESKNRNAESQRISPLVAKIIER